MILDSILIREIPYDRPKKVFIINTVTQWSNDQNMDIIKTENVFFEVPLISLLYCRYDILINEFH